MNSSDARKHPLHAAIKVGRDMDAIIDMWPALVAGLAGGLIRGGSGRRRPDDDPGPLAIAASPAPISLHVADVTSEVQQWVTFLARVLMDELTIETPVPGPVRATLASPWRPRSTKTPNLLREISREHVGHFTEHADQMLALAVEDDAARLRRLVERTVNPSERRTVRLGIPCEQHGTSDMGERIVCTGQYETVLDPETAISDLVCSRDETHRMTPLEWQRSQRRSISQDRDMDALMHGARVRHVSGAIA